MIIIPLPLIGVTEHIICLLDILEYLSGVLVLILIGMPLEGGLLIGSVNVLLGDIPVNVEELIVASLHGL
jgi:hypothetical protein